MDSFYVTLPSNSSLDIFPDNSLAHYFTQLSKPLTLQGAWEVALSSISYPRSWYDIESHHGAFKYRMGPNESFTSVTFKDFRTREQPHRDIMDWFRDACPNLTFDFQPKTGKMTVSTEVNEPFFEVEATGRVATLMGFYHPVRESVPYFGGDREFELDGNRYTGDRPMDRDPLHELFIYTNIIENQLVGDTSAPLLKTVASKGRFPQMQTFKYDRLEYHSVISSLISTIEIDIRDETGERVPFQTGRVVLTLHFRQKRSVLL